MKEQLDNILIKYIITVVGMSMLSLNNFILLIIIVLDTIS